MGSIPPAEAFEHPMRELVAVIDNSKLVPSPDDLEQVAKGVRSQRMNYCEDTGSVNTLSVALDPPLTQYTIGLPLHVKIKNNNTGPATIDAGAGRVPIRKPNGAEMAAGDLPAYGMAGLIYDGTVFQMINFGGAGAGGAGDVFQINIPYCVDIGTVNQVIANFSPAITSLSAGLIVMVKISNTNNSFANININGLGNKPIYAQGGHPNWPLLPGDIMVGDTIVFIYDGSAFWIYPNAVINQSIAFTISSVAQFDQLFVALGRKRISTSGFVTIKLAPGVYGPGLGALGGAVLVTYHPDSDRITIEGSMQAGQSPPTVGNFQRTGNGDATRANDGSVNLSMLRSKYATEIRITGNVSAVEHRGPGQITYKNLFITGPAVVQSPQNGIMVRNSRCSCVNCCLWGMYGGFVTLGGGAMTCWDCHANYCMGSGWAAGGSSSIEIFGGGSYSNNLNGVHAGDNASVIADAPDRVSLSLGFQSSQNGGYGTYADQGVIAIVTSSVYGNANVDMIGLNAGISAQHRASVGTMSPLANTVGNLNAISVAT
jgi:hypothetical protein